MPDAVRDKWLPAPPLGREGKRNRALAPPLSPTGERAGGSEREPKGWHPINLLIWLAQSNGRALILFLWLASEPNRTT